MNYSGPVSLTELIINPSIVPHQIRRKVVNDLLEKVKQLEKLKKRN